MSPPGGSTGDHNLSSCPQGSLKTTIPVQWVFAQLSGALPSARGTKRVQKGAAQGARALRTGMQFKETSKPASLAPEAAPGPPVNSVRLYCRGGFLSTFSNFKEHI